MDKLVKNQHYVWRAYLRPWAEDEKIYCWRRRQNKVFQTNLMNIGSERFFYHVHPMTARDIEYLNAIIADEPEDLRSLFIKTIDWLQTPFYWHDQVDFDEVEYNQDENAHEVSINELIEGIVPGVISIQQSDLYNSVDEARENFEQAREKVRTVRDHLAKTIADKFHGQVEHEGEGFLASLRTADCDFINNETSCINFFNFLAHQRFRTRKFREEGYKPEKHLPGVDLQRTWLVENHIRATRLGLELFLAREELGFIFLKNGSEAPFITGDQPILELDEETRGLPKLFYPLGPSLAMILGNRENCCGDTVSIVKECTVREVTTYNRLMVEGSFDQVYANDQTYLTALSEERGPTVA